jgi:trans-2-enoyl-CoA reductase
MGKEGLNRRSFLKAAMITGAAVSAASMFPKFSWANVKTATLSQVEGMRPEEIARSSRLVMDSWQYLVDITKTIENPHTCEAVASILRNPAPTFMADLMDAKNRKEAYLALSAEGLVKDDLTFDQFLPLTNNPYRPPTPLSPDRGAATAAIIPIPAAW